MESENKKRPSEPALSPTTQKKKNRSQDPEFKGSSAELFKGSDDIFHLSLETVTAILDLVSGPEYKVKKEDIEWDEYATSFYNKILDNFQRSQQEEQTKENSSDEDEDMAWAYESASEEDEDTESTHSSEEVEEGFCRPMLFGPHEFGSYCPGNEPDRMPYHLYLMVKEVADITKHSEWHNNPNDVTRLTVIESKIWFFFKYFYSHLPIGWEYDQKDASNVVASYDPTREPRYNMAGYTHIPCFEGPSVEFEFDFETNVPRNVLIDIMSIVYQRKTPKFWKMPPGVISFYCKICSCFGIDYSRLESASDDDVCLMHLGRNGELLTDSPWN